MPPSVFFPIFVRFIKAYRVSDDQHPAHPHLSPTHSDLLEMEKYKQILKLSGTLRKLSNFHFFIYRQCYIRTFSLHFKCLSKVFPGATAPLHHIEQRNGKVFVPREGRGRAFQGGLSQFSLKVCVQLADEENEQRRRQEQMLLEKLEQEEQQEEEESKVSSHTSTSSERPPICPQTSDE